ncbi:acyl-CoA thioester hydrolase/BAAT C-terminal domain-containing protein [Sphingorhabdus sp. M41]|uniref:acyl-CoA thioester hydrolase/BAAT C-terminal domain-containing protein n=1 Tax=Sphingorhabdus sp. M41 TaxID=1806885 RepID=UPI00078B238C|nr:acyl-CoA thioester hydrolase/BAAT C-terminal domain-containing protein [Sphingorhabdus sp. M41]AMO72485.1 hypothetical protein AZE99_12045 [Sphingorhabdus sp. M41]
MRWKKIFGFGCLGLIALLVVGGGAAWYFMPGFPITVDEPGEGGIRITINDRPAHYFHGDGEGRRPAILMLGGSEGGLQEAHHVMARMLNAEGFSVLYPGYYRTSKANSDFNLVPLETFDMALEWLKSRDDVNADAIGIMGGSKGGEAALLVASRHPELKAVVSQMPSNVVWQGFSWESWDATKLSSSWSLGGKPVTYVPYIPLGFPELFAPGAYVTMYKNSLKQLPEYPDAVIKIEKTKAPVLLICGEKDNLWPSCDMARAVEARAKKFGQPDVTLLAYEDAGHSVTGKPREETAENYERLSEMGGTAKGNNDARKDNWPKIIAFFKQNLGADSN